MTAVGSEFDDAWLAEIVRRVVERLRAMADDGGARSKTAEAPTIPSTTVDTEVWQIGARVVTLATLKERPASARRLRVAANAVVTPAVRDEIRLRGWVLEREAAGASSTKKTPRPALVTPCFLQTPPGIVDGSMIERPVQLRPASHLTAEQLRDQVSAAVKQSGRAVVVALEPYVAVCELNRDSTLRAGYAPSATALSKLVQQLRPNVVVIDARRITHGVIRGAIDELESLPAAACDRGDRK